MRLACAALAITACLVAACGSRPEEAADTAASPASLPPVSLPDLSSMDPAVQAQLRQQSEARAYGEVGRLLMAAEYFEAAEPYLLHAQAQAPEDVRWPYYLGHVHMANAEPAQAVAAFQRALQLQPDDLATLVWLGNLHLDQGEPQRAEPLFSRAIAAQPTLVAALFGLGRAALARRDFARAADYFEQVLAADPRASVAHYPLALAYRALGDTAKAEAHLRQRGGVEVGPPDPLMVELRGSPGGAGRRRGSRGAGTQRRRLPHGGQLLSRGGRAGTRQRRPSTQARNGVVARRRHRRRDAGVRGSVAALARLRPGPLQPGRAAGLDGVRCREATEHLAAAVKSQPDYVDARLRLAEALREGGKLEQSLAQYRAVLAIDPRWRTRASATRPPWQHSAACARLATPSAKGRACTLATPGSPRRQRAWNQRSRAADPCRPSSTRSASASVTGST